jgi:Na+/H+-dicarboxylate symporter
VSLASTFVSVAMVYSLGSLDPAAARTLARFAGTFLLVIWAATLAVVLAIPLAFPGWEAASFFSTSLVEQSPPFDPIGLYLPANPFRSFAEGVVPAIVVFSVALGLALMAAERKGALLESLGALQDALQRVAGFVVTACTTTGSRASTRRSRSRADGRSSTTCSASARRRRGRGTHDLRC